MKRMIRRLLLLAACACLMLSACGNEKTQEGGDEALLKDCPLIHQEETSGVNMDISIDDFNALGFEYGDSVDIAFSNGYAMEDIPYYNGYYVQAYEPLLVAYPDAEHVKATINYGDDLWDIAGLGKDDTATVSLREKAKYLKTQQANDIHYTDNRDDYPSDEVFANFREVAAGDIKEGVLYRSASPCNNVHKRAPYTDRLAEAAGIKCIVDLADCDEDIEGFIASDDFDSPYFLSLYKDGDVLPLYLSLNYQSEEFQRDLSKGLTEMAGMEGPYLVHCTEGKDRTGFVCMLLEALCGASYEEIEKDYMLTYDNYYGITEESDPERYDSIRSGNLDVMIRAVVSDDSVDITKADLSGYARDYMTGIGMDEQTIDKIRYILEN